MNKTFLATALALAGAVGFSGAASAAQVSLLNMDPAGVGLNDTTPIAARGGNPGRTVGEQRRIAYQFAMDLWGAVLESDVEIKIYASFAPLGCTATGGTLAQAGTNWIYLLTSDRQRAYPAALADSLVGFDLQEFFGDDPTDPGDIFSQFNGDLGKPTCLAGSSWYYGVDGKTPAGSINFLNVVMHEIGHGLGAAGFLNKTTGQYIGYSADPAAPRPGWSDHYTINAYDNALGLPFEQMTAAQRATAMRTPGRTVWTGGNMNAQGRLLLDNMMALQPTAPAALVGSNYEMGKGTWGPAATAANFSNQLVLANDGVGAMGDGCETPFANAAAVAGKIAVIDRGTCGFAVKVLNAQLNGAVGVVIANNAAGVIDMGGAPTAPITIPSVMVSLADANAIKANLPVSVRIGQSPQLAGMDAANRTRLYSPSVVAGGSTYSHVDTALAPNALMEPFDTPEVQSHLTIDVTPALFADVGWALNPGGALIGKCNTTVDAVADGGLIVGANVAAHSGVCATQAAGSKASYVKCMTLKGDQMRQQKLITTSQYAKVLQCAAMRP